MMIRNTGMADTAAEDIRFMRLALEEARRAFTEGEVPVGAVLVKDTTVMAAAYNMRESSKDPCAHAEISVLRAAAAMTGNWRLSGAVLYVTKEPCVMCAGAIVNSRISRLVYGCKDAKAGAVDSLYAIPTDRRLNHRIDVVSGILEGECASLLKTFFSERRK